MKKTTTTTPSSSRCRTQKSVSYEWRPFEAPSKVPRPPPCERTGSCATRTRRTDLHLRVCVDGAFRRSLNSARTKDLTFQAPKRDFLVPDAPKTSTLCTPHKLGRDPWLLICTWGGAQTRDLAIPVELSSIARAPKRAVSFANKKPILLRAGALLFGKRNTVLVASLRRTALLGIPTHDVATRLSLRTFPTAMCN